MNIGYAKVIASLIARQVAKKGATVKGAAHLAKLFKQNPKTWFQTFFSWHNSAYYKGELVGVAKGIQNTLKQANYLARQQGKTANAVLDEMWKGKKMLDMEFTRHKIGRLNAKFKSGQYTTRNPRTNYEKPTKKFKELQQLRKTEQELLESSEPYARVLKRDNPYHNEVKDIYTIQKQDAWSISGFGQDKGLLNAVNINQSDKVTNLILNPSSRMTQDLRRRAISDPRFRESKEGLRQARTDYQIDSNMQSIALSHPAGKGIQMRMPLPYGKTESDNILKYAFDKAPKGLRPGGNPHEIRFNPSRIEPRPWHPKHGKGLLPDIGNKTVAGHTASVDYSYGDPLFRFFDVTDFTRGPLGKLFDKQLEKVVITGITK